MSLKEKLKEAGYPTKLTGDGSHMMLEGRANPQDLDAPIAQMNSTTVSIQLTESAEKIFNTIMSDYKSLFDFSMERINLVRNALADAECMARLKREAAERAVREYVAAVQELDIQGRKLQQSVGEMLITGERLTPK